jgi:hypothetical protein
MSLLSTHAHLFMLFLAITGLFNKDEFVACARVPSMSSASPKTLGAREQRLRTSRSTPDPSFAAHKMSSKVQGHLNKRRSNKRLPSSMLESSSEAYGLGDMNCNALGLTGYACRNYMLAYLNEYVVLNGTYNPLQIPVPETLDVPQVELLITFMDLLDIDIVTGTMTASLFVDMFWEDEIIPEWNVSLTNGINELVVPNGLLWEPDVQVYNSVGAYFDQIDSYAVFLYPDGSVWWSGRGVFTFACEFDVTQFPFDSQSCQLQFASWLYSESSVNISSVSQDVNAGFTNLAWEVTSVKSQREIVMQWETYAFPYGIYTLSVARYSSHYVTTTILPALIITVIVIAGLFIPNHASRLSLCVTGLLTVIAIQVGVVRLLAPYCTMLLAVHVVAYVFVALCNGLVVYLGVHSGVGPNQLADGLPPDESVLHRFVCRRVLRQCYYGCGQA